MSKINVAFIWNFRMAKDIYPNWRDGQRACIEEINKKYPVDWYLAKDCSNVPDKYDILIFWTDSNDPIVDNFINYKAKKVLLLTSDLGLPGNIEKYNLISCESNPILKQLKLYNVKSVRGMGTDTNFYKPNPDVRKDIEYFYPATFSPWKKQSDIAYLRDKLLCVGTVQPDGQEELDHCLWKGVRTEIGYFPAEKIRDYYQRTQKMIIPAIHGSERTVLEAMACNILPEVTNPNNAKTQSYIREYYLSQAKSPRQFILRNYSHQRYAKTILEGLFPP